MSKDQNKIKHLLKGPTLNTVFQCSRLNPREDADVSHIWQRHGTVGNLLWTKIGQTWPTFPHFHLTHLPDGLLALGGPLPVTRCGPHACQISATPQPKGDNSAVSVPELDQICFGPDKPNACCKYVGHLWHCQC